MLRAHRWTLACGLLALVVSPVLAADKQKVSFPEKSPLRWYTDYKAGMDAAKAGHKQMLVYFHAPKEDAAQQAFLTRILSDKKIQEKLSSLVLVKIPTDTQAVIDGESIDLFKHSAFAEMQRTQGVAIVDLVDREQKYFGYVVSVLPFLRGQAPTAQKFTVLLDLPPGTLTQRTLIYAVRTHPEAPRSTRGRLLGLLARKTEEHSQHQANIQVQGHHNWENRFQTISAQLPGGCHAQEVCAESWPGQGLVDAAEECVASWRQSSGHWSAVQAEHPYFGYDMKRGHNGIWYATGIFGRRS